MSRSWRDTILSKLAGKVPVIELECKSRNVKFWQPDISGGMIPVNRFDPRSRKFKFVNLPISRGMDPIRWLSFARNRINDEQFPISGGIWFDNSFPNNNNLLRFFRLNKPFGIGPVSEFCDKSIASRFRQFDMELGIEPSK
ncbi:hypothetical protein HanRHA438_Chr09g0422941 [Helianthus annuus]|nr:hypothetical protein HanIR_Chr09g0442791 [Helianthus annuus]KAJ0755136.1 hypothetical protein HanPI659440_Chr09g0354541 [Helianthus annuus]KAJ0890364.1 hypothetical protein HanRHA438_Chr09g0422941 [Helianthus annuus]